MYDVIDVMQHDNLGKQKTLADKQLLNKSPAVLSVLTLSRTPTSYRVPNYSTR